MPEALGSDSHFNGGSDSSYIIHRAQELGSHIAHITYNIDLNPYCFEANASGRFTAEFIPSL